MSEPSSSTDLRLLPAAALAWLGAWLAVGSPGWGGCVAAGAAVTAAVIFLLARGQARRRWHRLAGAAALALTALALTSAVAAWQGADRIPAALAAAAEDGAAEVTATVSALARDGPRSSFVRAETSEVNGTAVAMPITLWYPHGEYLAIGSSVRATVQLKLTEPGERVVALAFADEPPELVAEPSWLLAIGNGIRDRFVEQARSFPNPGGALVPGLVVGDERLVDDELSADMRTTSLTHLTAVSGSNIALIVAGIIGLGRLLGWRRGVRLAAAGLALAAFVLLVTPQGSVVRAGAMAVIVVLAESRSRPLGGASVLCLAVIVLLVADPWLSRDYGFALSAAATAGLVFGTRPLAARLERWLPPWLALTIAVPVMAQLACQPILILLDARIPVWGIVANLLAAPAAPVATVLGLIALIIGSVIPALATLLIWPAWLAASWVGAVAHAFASLPDAAPAWLPNLPVALGAGVWLIATVAVLVLVLQLGPRRMRAVVGAALAATLVITLAVFGANRVVRQATFPEHWRVAACDIGQGDAILLRSDNVTLLIDTGDDPDALNRCFALFGLERIDVLVLSHFDRDHVGAASSLMIPIGRVLVPDTEQAHAHPLPAAFVAAGIPVEFAGRGGQLPLPDADLQVLWPKRSPSGGPSNLEDNASSLALRIQPSAACTTDCLNVLALGDMGEAEQDALLALSPDVRADVLKVAHHGSRDTSPRMTAAAAARVALISVGADNGYGHPTDTALSQLEAAGTATLRTDERGTCAIFTRSGAMEAWCERPSPVPVATGG